MNNDQKLKILIELCKNVSKEKDIESMMRTYINFSRDLIDCERCSTFLYDDENNEVYSIAAHGTSNMRMPANKGIVGLTVITKELQITNDPYHDFRFNKDFDKKTGFLTKNIMSVPILSTDNEVLGVFQALNSKHNDFIDLDKEMIAHIANYIGVLIENFELRETVKDLKGKVKI